MSEEHLYEQQLLREHDLRHRAEVAGLNRKKALVGLADAEKEVRGVSKLLPFMAKSEKAAVESAARRVDHWESIENECKEQLAETEKQLDVSTLTKIREEGSEEYLKGQNIKDFYSLARERVDVFRMRVRDFLVALGQARGAMSTGYNNAQEDYSQNAKDRLRIALKVAHKLDIALSDVELLNEEFKAKSKGTTYSKIEMPSFNHVEYEAGVRRVSTLPIAKAQMEIEKTLDYCEQLSDQGVSDVINEINALEHSHEDIMLEVVRGFWRVQQKKLLQNSKRAELVRSEMVGD